MKHLIPLLILGVAIFSGCANQNTANKVTNEQEQQVHTTTSELTPAEEAEARDTTTGSMTFKDMRVTIADGWTAETDTETLTATRPDPIDGVYEGEVVNKNQGHIEFFFIQESDDGSEYASAQERIAESTCDEREDFLEMTVKLSASETMDVAGKSFLRCEYRIASNESGDELNTDLTAYAQWDNDTIIGISSKYGSGTDSNQLRADILGMIESIKPL